MAEDKNNEKKLLKKFSANTPRRRMMKLAGMSTSIATKAASNAIKSPFQSKEQRAQNREQLLTDIGLQVAQTLGEMKGAVMKVGQVASQIKDLLPEELAGALEKLQKDAPPIPFSLIQEQFIAELGDEPEQLFKHFDKEPFAAASIGQVHRATTKDGQEIVVKIQYPGVDESCESDLKQLRLLLKLGGLVKIEKHLLDEIFDEIREQLHQELDYENEAKNLKRFYEFHVNDPEIVIPQVIDNYSTKRVLSLQYEPGDKLDEIIHIPAYDQSIRNQIGHNLFSMVVRQIYELKAIHADPHPGNFAFRPDGTIIVYDFGAVKDLPDNILQSVAELTDIAFSSRYHEIDDQLIKMGARKQGGKRPSASFYQSWTELILPVYGEQPFDFAHSHLHQKVVEKGRKSALKYLGSFQPVPQMMHLNRVLSGHYWNFVAMEVNASFRHHLDPYIGEHS